ncbi:TAFII28-domain-containing protein [Meredithblackwellia eburnea MCA 4105]
MKRTLNQQGSPPPSSSLPAKKKARPSTAASSSALARSSSNRGATPLATASSPPYLGADSPAPSRARSRSRSVSVVPGAGSGKGKDREREKERATPAPGPGDAGQEPEGDPDADDEDEQIEYSDDEFGMNQKENARQKQDLRVLMEHFDNSQMDRYEAFRRSGLTKSAVRKLVNQVLQQSVSPTILTVVRGFSKVFVGEIVEKARSIATQPGPLTPADLREAYRLYQLEHDKGGMASGRKKMFVR